MSFKFLALEKEAFGLDISDLSLKLIKLKEKRGGFVLESYNQADIEPGVLKQGVIKNEDKLAKIIKEACLTAQGKKITMPYVIASLPEEKSFLQVIQMPRMEEKDLKSAIVFEVENYIPLPINEVYFDFQVIPASKNHTTHLDVLIVAMPKKIVNSYVSCFEKAGLIPIAFEVESQAISRALIKNDSSSAPVILIDFGKNSTDVIVFFENSIRFTCSLPISSMQLTVAIAEALKVNIKKADELKIKHDLYANKRNEKAKKIQQAIDPILNDLVLQIKKYIDFYQNHAYQEDLFSNEKIEKILLCGGGANLKGLTRFFQETLKIHTVLSYPQINFSSRNIPNQFSKNALSFITALGLALRKNV